MTISYTLVPVPRWYLADLTGKPLSGGQMFTFSNLNPTLPKTVYMDAGGANAWTNPIIFDENGQQGPFFWRFDTLNPNDSYYIRVLDANGNLQWDIFNYGPGVAGGGGGGSITTALNINNLITNNVFWRNVGSIGPPLGFTQTIAPSIHDGFSPNGFLPLKSSPDITFVKDNVTAIDSLTFTKFIQNSTDLSPDITPEYYLNYTCTGAGTSENYKYVAIPISLHLQSIANTSVTISIYARVNSGPGNSIILYWMQSFGEGGSPSSSTQIPIQTFSLTNNWAKYTVSFPTPSLSGKTLGDSGTDALYLLVQYPLSVVCNIDIAKPAVYLGTNIPSIDFVNYDQVNSIISSPRTGDIRTSLNTFSPYGWVPMNDGTIGNTSSNAITRANVDTFPLFSMIWNAFNIPPVSQAFAQMYDNLGNKVAYGANPESDFSASRQLSLTKSLGRVIAGTAAGLPILRTFVSVLDDITLSPDATAFNTGDPVVLFSTGTLPTPLVGGVTYYVIRKSPFSNVIRLASTYDNAISGTQIVLSGTQVPTNTIMLPRYNLGNPIGEETHLMTLNELVGHTHTFGVFGQAPGASQAASFNSGGSQTATVTTSSNGNGQSFNVIQPTTYMNVFIKL